MNICDGCLYQGQTECPYAKMKNLDYCDAKIRKYTDDEVKDGLE
jgi:hypothetical protein